MAECVSTDLQYGESSMKPQSVCFICEKPFDTGNASMPVCSKCRTVLKALCTCSVITSVKDDVSGVTDIPL